MLLVAYLVCTFWATRRAKTYDITADVVGSITTTALISGVLGARIMHFLLYPEGYHSFGDFLKLNEGGLVLYGFILTTPLALWWSLRRHDVDFSTFFMIFTPVVPLGIGIGRVGCFFNGCCYGVRGDQPWCVLFPEGAPAYGSGLIEPFPVHPSQLYAFAMGLSVSLCLRSLPTIIRSLKGSQMALSFLFLYGLARLIEEGFRGDTPKHVMGFLTAGQGISLLLILVSLPLLAFSFIKEKRV
jgi:phosphatidylglycerol---prolipoprotein diacylglyceryl transferase